MPRNERVPTMKATQVKSWCGMLFVMAAALAATGDAPPGASVAADSGATADRSPGPTLFEVRERAVKMPIDARNDIDKRIGVTVERVNREAQAKGQRVLAGRLAREFGRTTESLLDEKAEHGLSWGELVIAHTLLDNSESDLTLLDLVTLRSEGLGWGAIAFGLRFHMEDLENAIKAEGRVAMGLSKTDSKAPPVAK